MRLNHFVSWIYYQRQKILKYVFVTKILDEIIDTDAFILPRGLGMPQRLQATKKSVQCLLQRRKDGPRPRGVILSKRSDRIRRQALRSSRPSAAAAAAAPRADALPSLPPAARCDRTVRRACTAGRCGSHESIKT